MAYTPEKRPPSHREPRRAKNSLSTAAYDSNGVLDVLRLQKQEENKRNRPDFSGMWKWKDQSNQNTSKPPKVASIENKVNHVKKMHELYRQNVGTSAEINGDDMQPKMVSPRKMQLSPIQQRPQNHSPYQKPQTPVVKDKDLTTDDYETVSKYFKLHSPKPFLHQSTRISSPQRLPIISSPVQKAHSPSELSSVHAPVRYREMQEDIIDEDQYTITADQSLLQPNSPDGLLNWCATLNIDFIDDLY